MRSKALSFLLSLSLMFCVGFGSSLTASAATVSPDAKSEWFLFPFDDLNTIDGTFDTVSGNYHGSGSFSNTKYLVFTDNYDGGVFPAVIEGHRYLYYFTYTALGVFDYNRTIIRPDSVDTDFNFYLYPDRLGTLISYSNTYVQDTTTITGIVDFVSDKTLQFSTGSGLLVELKENLTTSGRQDWAFYLLDITDSSESEVDQIITAINNQTADIQQSIEDQYGGDPGSSFPVDDIITQHNEKMGVLSFSSDALMQVLGLLSPDQTLSSELVFPSMSLTIAGQRNKVQLWPEYRFDLNTLKQHWPNFVGLMQSLTTALVWIFVLRYCYRVFEKYFLAGGGS